LAPIWQIPFSAESSPEEDFVKSIRYYKIIRYRPWFFLIIRIFDCFLTPVVRGGELYDYLLKMSWILCGENW
jgi:hypothetical protein